MICFVETCYTYNPTLPLWLKSFDLFFVNMCLSLYLILFFEVKILSLKSWNTA
jgi:hypothetical protein